MAILRAEHTGTLATAVTSYTPEEGSYGTPTNALGTASFSLDGSGNRGVVSAGGSYAMLPIDAAPADFTTVIQLQTDAVANECDYVYRAHGADESNS
ncbi:MAG: hypothetical protein H7099_14640 [Gemmatimonadaceae bacterium]|nr:hypothetical protein [Gemmatimonadaceae bacterium]